MNAVGIDVSKGKSIVAALRPMGEVALLPQEFLHTEVGLEQMAYTIIALGEDTRVIMEATGRYHEPVAAALHEYGIYVCVLNPLFIKQSGGGSIRKVKTDKADAMKIAKYGLDNWVDLREYTPIIALFFAAFQRVEFPHLLNHLAVNKRLHALRGQRTGSFAALIVCPLFASQVGDTISGVQTCQGIAATSTLDFPGQPCVMAFSAILECGVL